MKTQGEGGPLQAKQRGLRRNQLCLRFDLRDSRTVRKLILVVKATQFVVL